MKFRIALWASIGLFVVAAWQIYIFAHGTPMGLATPLAWTLVQISCPVVFAGFYFHFGVSVYWVLIANAATYALAGLIIEGLRRQLHHAK
ncbi:MAG TPA: hypothetical protein VH088_22020 [Terriglobales bacterium]|jgi:hypothetical protein|nr:hypothetical protein [Terriglobales bacterium]